MVFDSAYHLLVVNLKSAWNGHSAGLAAASTATMAAEVAGMEIDFSDAQAAGWQLWWRQEMFHNKNLNMHARID